MAEHILVVDDEPDLVDLVTYNLRQSGYCATAVGNGEEALARARQQPPDLILLDIMLPDLSGFEICRRLRSDPSTREIPIILLTARGEEVDRVVGFEAGADDYVVKPFSPRELILRVRAILRRATPADGLPDQDREVLSHDGLLVDIDRHRVTIDEQETPLTAIEFKLLVHLMKTRGRVQTRDYLLEKVWGYSADVTTRTVDTHVKRLREKLGSAGHFVETVRGVGYRFIEK